MPAPVILHIDTGSTIRGGQKQLILLANNLHDSGFEQAVATPVEEEYEGRLNGNIPMVPIPKKSITGFGLYAVKEAVREYDIAIIHAHDSNSHTIGLHLKRAFPHIKLVVSRRVVFPPSGSFSRRFKYGAAVDRYIAISRAVAKILESSGVPAAKIAVIPSGLDLAEIGRQSVGEFAIPGMFADEALRKYPCLLASAGSLTAEKDFATALAAMKAVSKQSGEIALLILGEGPLRGELESIMAKEKIDNVFLPGHVEPLAPIFTRCEAFVLTSRSEGLNTSAIEAAACGLPLIVSNTGGLPEIVEDGRNGILCEPGDPEGFAAAILGLHEDEKLRDTMSLHAREKAKAFDITDTARRTAELYNRILVE